MRDEEKLPDSLNDAVRAYNAPPDLTAADLEGMWSGVEAQAFNDASDASFRQTAGGWRTVRSILPIAAVLVIGIAIGRYSVRRAVPPTAAAPTVASADSMILPEPYQSTTSRYLGQTAALLSMLPGDVRAGRADAQLFGRAHDLLLTTRMLLDSPAAADPRIHGLLEDLELVLAQVVRLQSDDGRIELELLREALEQRDVLPRLRTAAANISADD